MPEGLHKTMPLQSLIDLVDDMVLLRKPEEEGFNLVTRKKPRPQSEESASREPKDALAGLAVADGVDLQLFSSEPMMLSPTSMDVDHLGRVWIAEAVNYRHFRNKTNEERKEGDRIIVMEDNDHDGKAEKLTVFYQGPEIDSPHGLCVLGNQTIVSAGANVWVFTDDDGDLKADIKRVLFTGIKKICDADGKLLSDLAGNAVENTRIEQGMRLFVEDHFRDREAFRARSLLSCDGLPLLKASLAGLSTGSSTVINDAPHKSLPIQDASPKGIHWANIVSGNVGFECIRNSGQKMVGQKNEEDKKNSNCKRIGPFSFRSQFLPTHFLPQLVRIFSICSLLFQTGAFAEDPKHPKVWIYTDMSGPTLPGANHRGTINDPDDVSAMAGYLLMADRFETLGIVVASTHRKEHATTPDQAVWAKRVFGQAYQADVAGRKALTSQACSTPARSIGTQALGLSRLPVAVACLIR